MNLIITIDPQADHPIFRQIMDRIIQLVDAGDLAPGTRLPSSRTLADRLEVNRSTVYRAYQELWSLGYLESRPGSYSIVRARPKVVPEKDKHKTGLLDWQHHSNAAAEQLFEFHKAERSQRQKADNPQVIDMVPLAPDSRIFPLDAFRKCMNQVLASEGAGLLRYGSPLGYRPLREFIAERMRLHSIRISADEIIITTGAQSAG